MASRNDLVDGLHHESKIKGTYDIASGRLYSTGDIEKGVSAGNKSSLIIENPANSGVHILVVSRFSVSGKSYVRKKDNVTKDSDGSSVEVNNRLLSADGAHAIVEQNPSVSGGNGWTEKVVGSGSGGASISGAITPTAEAFLQEGDNIYFVAENATSNSIDITIDVDFFEISTDEFPHL